MEFIFNKKISILFKKNKLNFPYRRENIKNNVLKNEVNLNPA